jgi:hypothetical protein
MTRGNDLVKQMNRSVLTTAASTVLSHGAIARACRTRPGYPFCKPASAIVSRSNQWLDANPEMAHTGQR